MVKKTAIQRELLVAVCNSGIINQLDKWVESNRRAKIDNMMIVAIDERLPSWLESHGVAYWRRKTSAAGSHKISAQKFMCVCGGVGDERAHALTSRPADPPPLPARPWARPTGTSRSF